MKMLLENVKRYRISVSGETLIYSVCRSVNRKEFILAVH